MPTDFWWFTVVRYTEVAHAGVVETGDGGMLVFFAGEQPALDNSKAVNTLNTPRDLAFVKVPFDLADKRCAVLQHLAF